MTTLLDWVLGTTEDEEPHTPFTTDPRKPELNISPDDLAKVLRIIEGKSAETETVEPEPGSWEDLYNSLMAVELPDFPGLNFDIDDLDPDDVDYYLDPPSIKSLFENSLPADDVLNNLPISTMPTSATGSDWGWFQNSDGMQAPDDDDDGGTDAGLLASVAGVLGLWSSDDDDDDDGGMPG